MDIQNNPAGRLLDILQLAMQQQDNAKLRSVWATVCGVPDSDTSAVLDVLADVIKLSNEAKAALEAVDQTEDKIFVEPFKNIEPFFSEINLENPWHVYKKRLTEATLKGLRYGAYELSRQSPYKVVKATDLEALQSDLSSLMDKVTDSDLPPELKSAIFRRLEGVHHSLRLFSVNGPEGLQEAIDSVVGALVMHSAQIAASASRDSGPLIQDMWTYLQRAATLITLAVYGNAAFQHVEKGMQALMSHNP